MKAKVTKRGRIIPKGMLGSTKEVEIRKEDHRIVISLLDKPDPVLKLSKRPVECGIPDASECHDRYLYGGKS